MLCPISAIKVEEEEGEEEGCDNVSIDCLS